MNCTKYLINKYILYKLFQRLRKESLLSSLLSKVGLPLIPKPYKDNLRRETGGCLVLYSEVAGAEGQAVEPGPSSPLFPSHMLADTWPAGDLDAPPCLWAPVLFWPSRLCRGPSPDSLSWKTALAVLAQVLPPRMPPLSRHFEAGRRLCLICIYLFVNKLCAGVKK